MDYLTQNFPEMTIKRKSHIIQNKHRIIDGKEKLKDDENEIIGFLNKYNAVYRESFENIPLVAYFITLRNLLVHSVFPHLFENQYENSNSNQKVAQRIFQRGFVNYLLAENGSGILLENGFRLLLENSENESFFDSNPLSKVLKEQADEKKKLYDKLGSDSPIKLMEEYRDYLLGFIQKFE